jgi:hypothetical protein
MNSHLILSLKPIYSTPFPLITFIYVVGFIWSFLGKVYSYQAFINERLSKQDGLLMVLPRLVKKVIGKIMLYQGGGEKIHTLEIVGHVQMAKNDPKAQRKSSLSEYTWLENEFGSFNLETLKFLMHFREPRSSLYFTFTHTQIFSFSHSYIFYYFFFFPSLLSFIFSLFLSRKFFFYLLPFEL